MAHKGLREPHLLLVTSNPQVLMRNLRGILTPKQIQRIERAVDREVMALYALGMLHLDFAANLEPAHWRQKVSRLYYAAYNLKRALSLKNDGSFSTDSSDHAKVDQLPNTLMNQATYALKLRNLRDDRNLADYSHLGSESDLLISVTDAENLVATFAADARVFLESRGVVW